MDDKSWKQFSQAYTNISKRVVGAAWRGSETKPEVWRLARSDAFEDALAELQDAFRHMHIASDDGDKCGLCGLDLRNDIHAAREKDL